MFMIHFIMLLLLSVMPLVLRANSIRKCRLLSRATQSHGKKKPPAPRTNEIKKKVEKSEAEGKKEACRNRKTRSLNGVRPGLEGGFENNTFSCLFFSVSLRAFPK